MLCAGIFCVAFATLLVEVSVIRVLSFTIWHHFGYIIISTALLGYGASGTLLALRPNIGSVDLRRTLTLLTGLSALSVVAVLAFIAHFRLDPMRILEDGREFAVFLAYLIFTAVPFFVSGLAISLSLREVADRVDRLYFWDLLGAGLGCGAAVVLMNVLTPPGAVVMAAAAFAVGAAIFAATTVARAITVSMTALAILGSFYASSIEFSPARSKHLTQMISLLAMEPRYEEWTSLFRTDLVENVRPRRECKELGLSATAPETGCEKPRYFIAHDGSAGAAIYDTSSGERLSVLDYHILRTPYLISKPDPSVMIIGVGGGRDIVVARQYGARSVLGLELDPVAIRLLVQDLEATRSFFNQPAVELVAGEGRHFVRSTDRRFDIIQITGVDTLAAEYSGSYVLAENYLYTVESFLDYLARLEPGGMLSISTGNFNPNNPRSAGRIASIAQDALRRLGIDDPENHIAVIDSKMLYVETMIQLERFTPDQIRKLSDFAEEYAYRVLHLPGRESNKVFDGLVAFQGEARRALFDSLGHLVDPVTDDRPFFFTFYRWSELLGASGLNPSHLTALGQIVLGILVVTLTILGALFILLPLTVFHRRGVVRADHIGLLGYFLSLGLGFMLFEISLIQRFVLFLGYPTYSLTVTLFSLLTFLGVGSYLSKRWVGNEPFVLRVAVVLIALLALFYRFGLPVIQDVLLGAPLAIRVVTTVLVLVPLGIVLGMFFPLGIRIATRIHPDLVPWAWAINGCASVTGGVLTIALAMTFGFTAVWGLSVVIYALGVASLLVTVRRVPEALGTESL